MKYFRQYRKEEIKLLIITLIGIVLQVVSPRILSEFVDQAMADTPYILVLFMIGSYLIITILQKGFSILERYLSDQLEGKYQNKIRHDMLTHLFRMETKECEKYSGGELMTRVDEDVEGVFRYYKILFLDLGKSAVILIGVLCLVGVENILLAFVMLALCIITIWVFKLVTDYGAKCYERSNRAAAKYNGFMKDKLDNLMELRYAGAQNETVYECKKTARYMFHEFLPSGMMYGRLWRASTWMEIIIDMVTLFASVLLWRKGLITAGSAYLLYNYVSLLYSPLQNFRNNLGGIQDAKAKKKRVEEFLLITREDSNANSQQKLSKMIEQIEIRDLHFSYQENCEVINGINLSIRSKEKIGIIGRTGGGKSTFVKLLTGFYRVDTGMIFLNGVDINDIDIEYLRSQIMYCPQKTEIFHATLRENITLFNEAISEECILNVLKKMELTGWIESFQNGLDTILEQGEKGISAGEGQLLSILRVVVRNPQIIILDEITSNLDQKSEKMIIHAIQTMIEEKTVMMISHHPAILHFCQRVYEMKNGCMTICEEDEIDIEREGE